jgi:hypothetical protein
MEPEGIRRKNANMSVGETIPATTPKTPNNKKRAKPASSEDDDVDATPSKKKKATPKAAQKKKAASPVDMDEAFPEDNFDFIKSENKWEDEFA